MYDIENNAQRIKFCREASDVQRCHTIRTIGEYSVGQHTFNMLAMLRILWPEATHTLIWAILEHDLPERLTGDIPAPSKWFGIVDKLQMAQFEEDFLNVLFDNYHEGWLNDEELGWLRGLDIIELWLFARDQINLGNRNFERMKVRIENYIEKNKASFPPKLLDAFYELRRFNWDIMPDLGD